MAEPTDKLAKTIEDTKAFVDNVNEKMDKAKELLDDNIKTVKQARQDYEDIRALVEGAKTDLAEAVETISNGADQASDGNLPGLIATIAEAVPKVTSAITRYTKAIADLKEKAENYKKAVEKNIEVVKSFQ